MKPNTLVFVIALALSALFLPSCETPTGQGAGWGAATGALVGAAATGNVQGAATGALIGGAAGALVGAAVEADQATRYGPRPAGGFPYARRTETAGYYQSPYPPHRIYDLRGIPHGAIVDDGVGGGYFRKP
jgi:hypothetical protein